jgi:hypothetical protein
MIEVKKRTSNDILFSPSPQSPLKFPSGFKSDAPLLSFLETEVMQG